MSTRYPDDTIDGRIVPRLVVTEDHVFVGVHKGGVHVEAGTFTLAGTIQGSLEFQPGASGVVRGKQQGSIDVASGATVSVTVSIEGSLHVARGGEVIVEPSGKLAGSLHNDGTVIVRGVFGGSQTGDGELRLEGRGYIKQPDEVRDGVGYYKW